MSNLDEQVEWVAPLTQLTSLNQQEKNILFAALTSTSSAIQVMAARAILDARDPSLRNELSTLTDVRTSISLDVLERLKDPRVAVRLFAMQELATQGSIEKIIPVLKLIDDMPVRMDTPRLREFSEPIYYREFDYPFIVFRLLEMMGENAVPAVPDLRVLLFKKNNSLAIAVLRTLGKIGEKATEATPEVIKIMTYQQPVRIWCPVGYFGPRFYFPFADEAVRTLGRIGPTAIPALVSIAENEKDPARYHAVVALGIIGPKAKSVSALIRRLLSEMAFPKKQDLVNDDYGMPTRKMAGSLLRITAPLRRHSPERSRDELLLAYASIQGWMQTPLNDLMSLFDRGDSLQKEAILAAIEERVRSSRFSVPPLMRKIENGNKFIQQNALYLLAQIPQWEQEEKALSLDEVRLFGTQLKNWSRAASMPMKAAAVRTVAMLSCFDYHLARFVVNQTRDSSDFQKKLLKVEQIQKILQIISRRFPEWYFHNAPWERKKTTNPEFIIAAIGSLSTVGPSTIPRLIELLVSEESYKSSAAAMALVQLGADSLKPLREALQRKITPIPIAIVLPIVTQISVDNEDAREIIEQGRLK